MLNLTCPTSWLWYVHSTVIFLPQFRSILWCPQSLNFELTQMWNKRAKKPFWRHMPRNPKNPYFSHGFLRVFYGFLRVFYGLGKHDVFPKHDVFEFHYGFLRVFYGLRRVFYGVPGFSSLGALFFPKDPNKFNVALWKDDSWIIGFYRFLCWAASMWLQNRIGNHRLIGMFEELVYLFIAPIQNYVQYVYIQYIYIYTLGFKYL